MPSKLVRDQGALLFFAVAAFCVVVIRACLQSITLDEAASFLGFAKGPWPSYWYPSSDNHVLNSILMRFAATVFGTNNLTVRLPAMLGALIYIGSALYLCLRLTGRGLLSLLLFICLVYNPMILDYLVAARGYSLAIGFLLAAIGVIASAMLTDDVDSSTPLRKKALYVSVLLALSCAANFSFAIVNGTTLVVFFLWAARRTRLHSESIRIALFSYLPGLLVGFLLCGSVILNWPKGELYFGSITMNEMWGGFATGSFDELNPYLVNPLLLRWLTSFRGALPYIVTVVGLLLFSFAQISRRRGPSPTVEKASDFVRVMVAVSLIALALHWLAFKIIHIALPKDRTGLFFLPLWTLAFVGSLVPAPAFKGGRLVQWSGVAVLLVTAFYFMGCLRLGYFKEWKFDSDTKTLYWIVDNLHRRCGIEKFGVDWRYHVPLNFYREEYKNYSLKEFSYSLSGGLPSDSDAYVIFFPLSEDFIKQHKLHVIYHNGESDAAVAIRSCGAEAATN
jgi:hypothetical protein